MPHTAADPTRKHHLSLAGNPQAEQVLVFAHGFGTDQRAWDAIWPHYAADFRIVRFDHVGAGRSDPQAFEQHRYLTMDRYAQDLNELLDALDLRDVVFVGHSMGALAGLLAAIERPEQFARLVAIGASARYLDDVGYQGGFSETDLNALYRAVTTGRDAWADAFAPVAMGNRDRPELAAHFAETIKSVPADAVLTVLCSIFQSDYREHIGRLERPTLLLQTREDAAVPHAAADYLHRSIRGSELVVLDAEGHLPHLSAPQQVLAAMDGFVRGHG
ncbi:alpha/beta hydrolase [Rubrivivax gelatinosus]|nr:alpha/beta hydrolase [Rubrivivax gelatinosus]